MCKCQPVEARTTENEEESNKRFVSRVFGVYKIKQLPCECLPCSALFVSLWCLCFVIRFFEPFNQTSEASTERRAVIWSDKKKETVNLLKRCKHISHAGN